MLRSKKRKKIKTYEFWVRENGFSSGHFASGDELRRWLVPERTMKLVDDDYLKAMNERKGLEDDPDWKPAPITHIEVKKQEFMHN